MTTQSPVRFHATTVISIKRKLFIIHFIRTAFFKTDSHHSVHIVFVSKHESASFFPLSFSPQAAMASGAAPAWPARLLQALERPDASPYVTYAARL